MTEPETPESIPASESEIAAQTAESPEPEEPQPEPWTGERVTEWNAYYDVYVMLGVLLLVFIASSNRITHSSIWNQLQVGRTIAANSAPLTVDLFSYTEEGKRWVNVPWLFDWSHAVLHKIAYDMVPVDLTDQSATSARAGQVAAGTLVAVSALVRVLTALVLLSIRRIGPGRWWSALCVALALGAVFSPTVGEVVMGGIAGPGLVAPETWGLLFLAIEMALIHRAVCLGRPNAAFGLVPLFLLWANVDGSFHVGLLVLAATTIGLVKVAPTSKRPADEDEPAPIRLAKMLGVLVTCALVCLVNPSIHHVYPASISPLLGLFRPATDKVTIDQLSFFGQEIKNAGEGWVGLVVFHFVAVLTGLASFVLNRRRFSLSRFLAYLVVVVLWATMIRYGPEFAVVFVATLALNGQEWYHDKFGTAGRLGAGWAFWSVGGRAVTILLIFCCVAKALIGGLPIPGFAPSPGDSQFGFGYDEDEFAFEAADFLKASPIKGNVLNTMLAQGDALVWRAYPERKSYMDSRHNLFPPELFNERQEIRQALSEDDGERWKPLLDKHQVSVVMLEPQSSRNTLRVLSQSPNWIPFYDSGNTLLFGRADADPSDVAFFKKNRLDAEILAFKQGKPTPPADRPPSAVTWMDNIFQTRALTRPQPHTESARRWLVGSNYDPSNPVLADPAHCLLAIREARTALASKPDDPQAYRLLAEAYRSLLVQETALLGGMKLTPETASRLNQISPRPEVLMSRFRERVTALNYAIQTTPPPKSAPARQELQRLNLDLFQAYASVNFVDLARDRLQAVLEKSDSLDFKPEFRTQMSQDLAALNEQVKQVENHMQDLAIENQYGPLQLASYTLTQGMPGLAIKELEEAERTGTNPAQVKPQLLDLYCDTGQPEKALEMLTGGQIEDPNFGTEAGVSPMRQGRSYFLLGNYEYAATLWEKYAIPRLRYERSSRALSASQTFVRGELTPATRTLLEIPDKIAMQAMWEYDAGLCRLEEGIPELAAEHFTKALTMSPKLNLRPVIAYYLEKLGKPVPEAPATPAPASTAAANAPATTLPANLFAPKEAEAEAAKKEEKPK
jgi:tetratricopeptide (TPR) repeat protein